MHVAKCEHVLEPVFAPALITAARSEQGGILKSPEKNVPNRQIREIVRVVTELVVHAM